MLLLWKRNLMPEMKKRLFSDSDGTDDFSSGEEGGVQAGILDGSVEAQMAKSSSVIEADIPVSNSLNTTCTIYKGSNLETRTTVSGLLLSNPILQQAQTDLSCGFKVVPLTVSF